MLQLEANQLCAPHVMVSTEFLYSSMMLSKRLVTWGMNTLSCSIWMSSLTVASGSPELSWRSCCCCWRKEEEEQAAEAAEEEPVPVPVLVPMPAS